MMKMKLLHNVLFLSLITCLLLWASNVIGQ
jgi:hypothetical protein